MTLFEYIAVANSIILSFAVVRLLDAIPPAFDPQRRDWVHFAFVAITLWAAAQYWWVSWSYSTVESWTYAKFMLYLIPPAIIYSQARAISSPDPSSVPSFRDYFQQIHRRFFGLIVVYMIVTLFGGWIIGGLPLWHPLRAIQLIGILIALSGVAISDRRYHAVLAGLIVSLLLFLMLRTFANPAPITTLPR